MKEIETERYELRIPKVEDAEKYTENGEQTKKKWLNIKNIKHIEI